jgi:hypothetical protein
MVTHHGTGVDRESTGDDNERQYSTNFIYWGGTELLSTMRVTVDEARKPLLRRTGVASASAVSSSEEA